MSNETTPKPVAREYLEALLIAVIFATFARTFVFQAFKIPSGSMEENLLIGDHILVNKFIYGPRPSTLKRRTRSTSAFPFSCAEAAQANARHRPPDMMRFLFVLRRAFVSTRVSWLGFCKALH